MKLEFINIKKAYLQAEVKRDIEVELPKEDREEGKCVRLRKCHVRGQGRRAQF